MPATLAALLAHPEFRMRLMSGAAATDAVMQSPISWVHSSDLPDPTPWLEPGQVLLTDGTQFGAFEDAPDEGRRFADQYTGRLRDRGVLALGLAADSASRIPSWLRAACTSAGLPLVHVDAATPFIGIIRHVADVLADDRRARLEWSLDAQRAVARAALQPDGLKSILTELSRRLDCWVALYDSAQHPLTVPGLAGVPNSLRPEVDDIVRSVLARGARAGLRIADPGSGITMQTLGQSDQLLGVLVVGTITPLDAAENDVVGSVIGLASIALEQRRTLDRARRRLRAGLFELLLSGAVDVADRTAATLWGPLPAAPMRVSIVAGAVSGQSLFDELELAAERRTGQLFFAESENEIIVIDRDPQDLQPMLRKYGLGAGSSALVRWTELSRGLAEARLAVTAVSPDRPFVDFERMAEHGVQGLLAASGGRAVAERVLQPILELPSDERDMMLRCVRVWLVHNGAWDPAARELGVHRHTLRSRIRRVDALLGVDLDSFAARAELWAALQLL